MKNYKIVFIKFDEIILIGFVIDIKLMFSPEILSLSLLLSSLLCCGFNRCVCVVGNKKCRNSFANKMCDTFLDCLGGKNLLIFLSNVFYFVLSIHKKRISM